jgi:UDP-2,3-diacylglucosamine pyrophosphatase LpxH
LPVVPHVIVFSDFHLSDAPAADRRAAGRGTAEWMRFRHPSFFVDEEFAAVADRLLAELGAEPFEVVFAGDVFELDGTLAWGRRAWAAAHDAPAAARLRMAGDEESETAALGRIVADHAVLFDAVGRLLARARRVVFLCGNHDLGLWWPKAQRLLRRHLARTARRAGARASSAVLRERVVFRPWFHRTGGVYVEHGHQFDPTAALPDPLVPLRGDGGGLWLSQGSLFFRYLMGHIGTMNPHNHESFLLGLRGYFLHWLRYYVRRGRALFLPLLPGWARLVWHAWRQRHRRAAPALTLRERALLAQLEATDLSPAALHRLRALHAQPAVRHESGLYAFLRQFGLDRVVVAALLVLLSVAGLLTMPRPHASLAALLLGLTFFAYERFAPRRAYFSYRQELPERATAIAALTGDHAIVFGHTHHAGETPLPGGARLLNSGTWANGFADAECRRRVNAARSFVWVRPPDGAPGPAVVMWQDGAIVPFAPAGAAAAAAADAWDDDERARLA